MRRWRLLQYISASGRKAIEDWRKSLPPGVPRADLDRFLKNMVKLDKWTRPVIDSLKGKSNQGLSELRWKSGGVSHRIFGYTQEDHVYVMMLVGCTHNDKKYKPPECFDTARTRRAEIANDCARHTCEYEVEIP